MPRDSAIIWQNADRTVTIIDIPHSISCAQTLGNRPHPGSLLSIPPLEKPYVTREPKNASKQAKLAGNTVEPRLHAIYASAIENAFASISTTHNDQWCFRRPFVTQPPPRSKKRKLSSEREEPASSDAAQAASRPIEVSVDFLPFESTPSISKIDGVRSVDVYDDDEEENFAGAAPVVTSPVKMSLVHPKDQKAVLDLLIPPKSSFVLGPVSDSNNFRHSVQFQAQKLDVPKKFDLILMDPPWRNRSVRRTHKTPNSTYKVSSSHDDIFSMMEKMDLDMLMADSCLVAIWITNSPTIRELVLGKGGLFEHWGVKLVEEWVWLKVTKDGEPVSSIDSLWMKPYEVLLIGRVDNSWQQAPRQEQFQSQEESSDDDEVKRRVIFGVPDLHSRKPCVKELIEPMMPDWREYRALEIFSRHLVAGWWSWGDECVKFNWQGYWQHDDSSV